jgi:hypothetical protein
LLLSS